MNEKIKLFISSILFIIMCSFIVYLGIYANKKTIKYIKSDVIHDTIYIKDVNEINKIQLEKDSIIKIKDSLNSELFIANYKLGRIKEYNSIAAKGNNIKYLRGWINRVLND